MIETAAGLLDDIPVPAGGWSAYVFSNATARLYPRRWQDATAQQEDFALCALLALQLLL